MTDDLFGSFDQLQRLEVPDAEIYFAQEIALPLPKDVLLQELITSVSWRAENVVIWGKTHAQPRLIAWYGDEGNVYKYSGISLSPLKWTQTLLNVRAAVERLANCRFNSVLLNYYRNEKDSMGFHSDDEPELGERPVIGSLSLGERRTFVLKRKHTKNKIGHIRLPLSSGSLLVMRAETQKNWVHGIEKESKPCGPRVNLTFRNILARK